MQTAYLQIKPRRQSGNVLFVILIAVALFAALSYVVTQERTGTKDISEDKANLLASQITSYASSVAGAVLRLKNIGGCTDEMISFENPLVSGYLNSNAPADKHCHVFHPSGGGLSFQSNFGGIDTKTVISARFQINGLYTATLTPGNLYNDLALYMLVDEKTCAAVNKLMGFSVKGLAIDNQLPTTQYWTGTYNMSPIDGAPDDGETVSGARSFYMRGHISACWKYGGDTTTHVFYHVLVAR